MLYGMKRHMVPSLSHVLTICCKIRRWRIASRTSSLFVLSAVRLTITYLSERQSFENFIRYGTCDELALSCSLQTRDVYRTTPASTYVTKQFDDAEKKASEKIFNRNTRDRGPAQGDRSAAPPGNDWQAKWFAHEDTRLAEGEDEEVMVVN